MNEDRPKIGKRMNMKTKMKKRKEGQRRTGNEYGKEAPWETRRIEETEENETHNKKNERRDKRRGEGKKMGKI